MQLVAALGDIDLHRIGSAEPILPRSVDQRRRHFRLGHRAFGSELARDTIDGRVVQFDPGHGAALVPVGNRAVEATHIGELPGRIPFGDFARADHMLGDAVMLERGDHLRWR